MLDYRIETFLVLCETMHYTKAAERLNISQPTVTSHIQYLEELYSCRLFSYSGKSLSLTEKGRQLYRLALSMRANSRKIMQALSAEPPVESDFQIGATKTIGEYVLFPLLKRHLSQYPNSRLRIVVDNTQALLQKLDTGELDFALIEGFFDQSQYTSVLLRQERFLGVCAPSHPLAGRLLSFADLQTARIILREPGSGTRTIFEQLLYGQNLTLAQFPHQLELNHFVLIKELVEAGLGITFVYEPVVRRELDQGRLVPLQLPLPDIRHAFSFVCLKDNLFYPRYEAFCQPLFHA